jgi:hypothetical protein
MDRIYRIIVLCILSILFVLRLFRQGALDLGGQDEEGGHYGSSLGMCCLIHHLRRAEDALALAAVQIPVISTSGAKASRPKVSIWQAMAERTSVSASS